MHHSLSLSLPEKLGIITLDAPTVKQLMRVQFATDAESSSQYATDYVRLEFGPGSEAITATATDGRRLAHQTTQKTVTGLRIDPGIAISDFDLVFYIPRKIARELARKKLGSIVHFEKDSKGITIRHTVKGEDKVYKIPPLTGRFPAFEKILEEARKNSTASISGKAVELRKVIDAVSTTVEFRVNQSPSVLAVQEEIPAKITGDPVTVNLNREYVGQFLDVLHDEISVELKFQSADDAVYGRSGCGLEYVVMPIGPKPKRRR